MDAAQLILHVTDNITILPRITIERTRIKFIATHADSSWANSSWKVKASKRTNITIMK